MTKNVFILTILILVFFQTQGFPEISNRIQGKVYDKETGLPIAGAEVRLMPFTGFKTPIYPNRERFTDQNGKFVFDSVKSGQYFVEVVKTGYTTFCPVYMLNEIHSRDYFNVFAITEGNVKHLEIKMEKGGRLRVVLNKKTDAGVSGFPDILVYLHKIVKGGDSKKSEDLIGAEKQFTNENGEVIFDGLIPNEKYLFSIWPENGIPYIEKIAEVKKNETAELTHTFDFTDFTGVSGKIKYSNSPVLYSVIGLTNIEKNINVTNMELNNKTTYSFINIEPGEYKLSAFVSYEDDTNKKKEIYIKIEKDKMLSINIEL